MNAYLRLIRLDRPLAILLLYILPCWWGITLAAPHAFPIRLLALFTLGAILIRGAGCTFNDLIDRDIDAQVTRTKTRPLASGELTPRQGFLFFCFQCLGGLCILLFLPPRCWPLSLAQLALLALYPFMKRITYWPQVILGFAINFGVIFGAVAVAPYDALNWPAVLALYGAGIAWTVGYDTIYALQDKEDDLKVGVKSTAIQFGDQVKPALALTYGLLFALLALVGYWSQGGVAYYTLIGLGALATAMQLFRLNPANAAHCQKIFAHPYLGWLIWGALLALSR